VNDHPFSEVDTCGCCPPATGTDETGINNPAGLDALRYRSATHPTALGRMLAALSFAARDDGRPLTELTTRRTDDPSIAILDAFAAVTDVLSFYQERIANEGFLRTATERRSVLELGRAIGYELRPGVAASTFLAFTIDDAAPSPQAGGTPAPTPVAAGTATVPAGTKVQSVPAKGGLPQTFETGEAMEGRAAWNALRPRQRLLQAPDPDAGTIYLEGTSTGLEAGDLVLFVTVDGGSTAAEDKRVALVTIEPGLDRTRVDLAENVRAAPAYTFIPATYATATIQLMPLVASTVQSVVVESQWREDELSAFMAIQGWHPLALEQAIATSGAAPPQIPPAIDEPALPGVYAFREVLPTFGHNAPRFESLPTETRPSGSGWDATEPPITEDSGGNDYPDADFNLERTVGGMTPGSWVVLERSNHVAAYRVATTLDRSLADFVLSARVTGVTVRNPNGAVPDDLDDFKMRSTSVHAVSRYLPLAALPIEASFGKGTAEESQLTLDTMVLGLAKERPVVITGERADLAGVFVSEAVVLADIVHSGGNTTLFFDQPLTYEFVRSTARINANVARASHGETVTEVLGSGDASRPNQRFELRRPPLTHVAGGAGGARSTLNVRVDDIFWDQAPSLYPVGPRDLAYVVRIDDDQVATVVFGDGERGARPGSGSENISATYRSGIGLPGQVAADSLTLLQTRPPGVRGVTNPVAASGAADPETLADARENAPQTVLAMGRIVSLRDYEDFASAYAGIGKAQAVEIRHGERSLVHITIAGSDGKPVSSSSELYLTLDGEVAASSDPIRRFRIDSFQLVYFHVAAAIRIDPRRRPEAVIDAVKTALRTTFSFARQAFGEPVTAADVVTAIQNVAGVEAVDLDALFRVDDAADPPPATLSSIVPAERARRVWAEIRPAQLLVINPFGIVITEATAP
jgi:hypothetical protein